MNVENVFPSRIKSNWSGQQMGGEVYYFGNNQFSSFFVSVEYMDISSNIYLWPILSLATRIVSLGGHTGNRYWFHSANFCRENLHTIFGLLAPFYLFAKDPDTCDNVAICDSVAAKVGNTCMLHWGWAFRRATHYRLLRIFSYGACKPFGSAWFCAIIHMSVWRRDLLVIG